MSSQAELDRYEFNRRDALWVYENHAQDMCDDEIFAYGDMGEDSTKYLRASPKREVADELYSVLKDIYKWCQTDQGNGGNLRYKPHWIDTMCEALALVDVTDDSQD